MSSCANVYGNVVMGMGLELSLILGVMGTVWTGNPLSLNPGFSIGGTTLGDGSSNILGNLLGLLGMPVASSFALHNMLTIWQESLAVCVAPTTGLSLTHRLHATTCTSLKMLGR
jgi:hypothetical protein